MRLNRFLIPVRWVELSAKLALVFCLVSVVAGSALAQANDAYSPSGRQDGNDAYVSPANETCEPIQPNSGRNSGGGYGEPYSPPAGGNQTEYYQDLPPGGTAGPVEDGDRGYYTQNEIVATGHKFFGSVSSGLAKAVEWAFKNAGRPNGYILGQDAGGALVAGLRYGEGQLYTKDAGEHRVYWQGPSVGYDAGAEGSKVMTLVYDMRDPSDVYRRFGGVEGSAYLVGGVSAQIQKAGHVTMVPIRAGVGLRLGANVGYLKYTRNPTWNPF